MDPMQAYKECLLGTLTRAKAEEVIELATAGSSPWAAYYMTRDCGSDRKWAEGVIEKATTGGSAMVAYAMVRECGSNRTWAERVIESVAMDIDTVNAACFMVRYCGSSQVWADKILAAWDKRSLN